MTTPRKDEKFTQKVVRRIKQFDRWVGRQVGRLEPHQRRTLGILMGVCAALSVAVGGVVYLVMKRNGTLPPESESDPFSTGVGIAVIFGYVAVKALLHREAALTAEQHYQRELRDVWKQERPLRDIKPWSQFMAWPQPQAGGVAVLIIRRDPHGSFTAETFDTLPADSAAERAPISSGRLAGTPSRPKSTRSPRMSWHRPANGRRWRPAKAERQARADTQAAEPASRTAAEFAAPTCTTTASKPKGSLRPCAAPPANRGANRLGLVEVAFEDDRVRLVGESEHGPPAAFVGSVLGVSQRDRDDGRDLVEVK